MLSRTLNLILTRDEGDLGGSAESLSRDPSQGRDHSQYTTFHYAFYQCHVSHLRSDLLEQVLDVDTDEGVVHDGLPATRQQHMHTAKPQVNTYCGAHSTSTSSMGHPSCCCYIGHSLLRAMLDFIHAFSDGLIVGLVCSSTSSCRQPSSLYPGS